VGTYFRHFDISLSSPFYSDTTAGTEYIFISLNICLYTLTFNLQPPVMVKIIDLPSPKCQSMVYLSYIDF
jgi:hypothetical protein